MTGRNLVSGAFRLDLADERLWRGGEAIPLGGKAFALLRVLMETPQILLTKDDLFDRVWPGLAVSESVLTTAIKDLRRALGDDARRPTVIETVHGRGYRYLLPVAVADASPPVAGPATPTGRALSRRPLALGAMALAVVVITLAAVIGFGLRGVGPSGPAMDEKSVAVLPFKDLSAGGGQAWFADGLTEEVLNSLGRTPDLRVVSQGASARFRDSDAAIPEVARQLSVAHVLEGSTRRSGDRLRVTVKLVRGSDGVQIWTKTYDRRDSDAISIQEDVAFDIARALKTVMEPAKLRAMVETGTRSVEAYEAYLRGVALNQREQAGGGVDLARNASAAFDEARKLDPEFAAAHWRAAQHWFGDAVSNTQPDRHGVSEAELLRRYLERVDMAVATSRNDLDKLKYGAAAAIARLRFREAHRLLALYVHSRPDDLDAWETMTNLAGYLGDRDEQAIAAERFHTLAMRDHLSQGWAISASVMTLDYPTAVQRARAHLKAEPGNPYIQLQAHRALIAGGQIDEARGVLKQIDASKLPPFIGQLASLRQACAEGRTADAASLRRKIDVAGPASTRWFAAQTVGDLKGAEAVLRPYDRPDRLPILMQFLVYPSLDARAFPALNARLVQEGITRPAPAPIPYACKAA